MILGNAKKFGEKTGALNIPTSNRLSHLLIDRDQYGADLLIIENRILGKNPIINNRIVFPASYAVDPRFSEEE